MIKALVNFYKTQRFLFWLALTTVVLVSVSAIAFEATVIRIIPLYVSIIIMILQANVNRYAFLLGALNSLLYAVVYVLNTQYASVVYAVLVSFPLQLVSFINWHKKSTGAKTKLRTLNVRGIIILALVSAATWVLFYFTWDLALDSVVKAFGLSVTPTNTADVIKVLDNTITTLGIVATVLIMLRYVEYTALQILSQVASIAIYCVLMANDLSQITYVIFSAYSAVCVVRAIMNIKKQLKEERSRYGLPGKE